MGVLLSLFVPGFGLVRAGRLKRGMLWFAALQLVNLAGACVWVNRAIPTSVAVAAFAVCIATGLWMLWDSCRPGRMTPGSWLLWIAMLVLLTVVPSLPRLVAAAFAFPTLSMEPTFLGPEAGGPDYLLVNKAAYWFREPQRGDLLVFRTKGMAMIEAETRFDKTKETIYLKRLVGLPGETIQIRDGRLFADGRQLGPADGIPPFTYVQAHVLGDFTVDPDKYVVPQDSYFVLGDNSPRSSDSRYWGYVPRANVLGKVARIYWPPARVSVPR